MAAIAGGAGDEVLIAWFCVLANMVARRIFRPFLYRHGCWCCDPIDRMGNLVACRIWHMEVLEMIVPVIFIATGAALFLAGIRLAKRDKYAAPLAVYPIGCGLILLLWGAGIIWDSL